MNKTVLNNYESQDKDIRDKTIIGGKIVRIIKNCEYKGQKGVVEKVVSENRFEVLLDRDLSEIFSKTDVELISSYYSDIYKNKIYSPDETYILKPNK